MAKRKRRHRKPLSTAAALQRAAERRALQLAVLADRERARALAGEKVDFRQLAVLESAAAEAAAVVVERKQLAARHSQHSDDSIEIVFVPGDALIGPDGHPVRGANGEFVTKARPQDKPTLPATDQKIVQSRHWPGAGAWKN